MGERKALLVFNDRFASREFDVLTAASEDVECLADLLTADHVGFAPEDVTVLANPSLVDFRQAVLKFYQHADRDDYLFFYYAGHGIRAQNGELHLALRKTTIEHFEADALDAAFIRAQLDRCFAEKKVVMLDCCHASAFAEQTGLVARNARHDAGLMQAAFDPQGTGTYVLGASQSGMSAYEVQQEDGSYSLFTRAFVEGVATGAAAAGKPTMTLADIANYIHGRRNVDGVATKPYLDVKNAIGLLEFARNPQADQSSAIAKPEARVTPNPRLETAARPVPKSSKTTNGRALWLVAALLAVGGLGLGYVTLRSPQDAVSEDRTRPDLGVNLSRNCNPPVQPAGSLYLSVTCRVDVGIAAPVPTQLIVHEMVHSGPPQPSGEVATNLKQTGIKGAAGTTPGWSCGFSSSGSPGDGTEFSCVINSADMPEDGLTSLVFSYNLPLNLLAQSPEGQICSSGKYASLGAAGSTSISRTCTPLTSLTQELDG